MSQRRSGNPRSRSERFYDGEDVAVAVAEPVSRPAARRRTTPATFAREVRDEMRQVAWPSRTEMVNYTTVVITTLVVMITLIFILNYAFGKGVLFLFQK